MSLDPGAPPPTQQTDLAEPFQEGSPRIWNTWSLPDLNEGSRDQLARHLGMAGWGKCPPQAWLFLVGSHERAGPGQSCSEQVSPESRWEMCCRSEVPSSQVLLSPKGKAKKAQRGSVICPVLHSKVKGSPGLRFMNIEGEHL